MKEGAGPSRLWVQQKHVRPVYSGEGVQLGHRRSFDVVNAESEKLPSSSNIIDAGEIFNANQDLITSSGD